ncbi:MAG: thioredoxin domain-containing protein [Epsilonproteobacteria bacterium]|nr:thioredoxin domain-containing protein [Campylobacterota bacterium]
MSSTLKLFTSTLLLSSTLLASVESQKVVNFLENNFKRNPSIVSLKLEALDEIPLKQLKGWNAHVIKLNATVKAQEGTREVSQKMIWFSNGEAITEELIDLTTGDSMKEFVTPSFKAEYYKPDHLIYGDANAKHKVVIFSDPLCPFCRKFVPGAIEDMRKDPKKFAIYYYHFPLPALHPAAVELTKAAIAAELKGHKDVVLKLYQIEIDAKERDITKILAAFNKAMNTNLKPEDISAPAVNASYNFGLKVADEIMVQGTPTLYFDGQVDRTKKKYLKAD